MVGEAPTTTAPPQLAAEKYMVGMLLADAEATIMRGVLCESDEAGDKMDAEEPPSRYFPGGGSKFWCKGTI